MALIPYSQPALYISENIKAPLVRQIASMSGHTGTTVINPADFVVNTGTNGTLNRAATNANTGIVGVTIHGEQSIWNSNAANSYVNQLFGASSVTNNLSGAVGLLPDEPNNVHLNPLQNNQLFEMNLSSTTGWVTGGAQQANIGTTVGLLLDTTTNLYVVDQTQANKIFTVYAKVQGPSKGGIGDLGGRVLVYVSTATALA